MAQWSAENATKAYLTTLKMGKRTKEPDISEFISAIAAGNNARLIVITSAGPATSSIVQALMAAARQTGAHVVCILGSLKDLQVSKQVLGPNADDQHIEFVIGDAQTLIQEDYEDTDFVVIDCNLQHHEGILGAVKGGKRCSGAIVLGYNAICNGSWQWSGVKAQLLPIGNGLLVTRIAPENKIRPGRKSNWVVKVDRYTGEEHVFRVRFPHQKEINP
ncbi:hypothetical protein Nepgr_010644 [Nepenthes gracilis]|uniref:DUF1442 family protein n=1 Tax=Nepenthes gracilis TaxID=150966 RepID=A0AAD3XLI8_NEPGR|nr:hypothetical protein Nepgr_010644 [Nepenthes gracilis]